MVRRVATRGHFSSRPWINLALAQLLMTRSSCLWLRLRVFDFQSRPQLQDVVGDEPDHDDEAPEEKQADSSTESAAVAATADVDNTDGAAADDSAAGEDGASAEDTSSSSSAAPGTADTENGSTEQQAPPIPPRRQASVQDVKDFFVDAGNKIEGAFESLKKHKMNALAVGRVPPTPDDAFAVCMYENAWTRWVMNEWQACLVFACSLFFLCSCVSHYLDGGSFLLCVEGRGQRSRFESKGLACPHGSFHFGDLHHHERICGRLDH